MLFAQVRGGVVEHRDQAQVAHGRPHGRAGSHDDAVDSGEDSKECGIPALVRLVGDDEGDALACGGGDPLGDAGGLAPRGGNDEAAAPRRAGGRDGVGEHGNRIASGELAAHGTRTLARGDAPEERRAAEVGAPQAAGGGLVRLDGEPIGPDVAAVGG